MSAIVDKDSAKALLGLVVDDLEKVDAVLREASQVEYDPLREVLEPILTARGKRLRPALLLLAARQSHYDPTVLVPASASVELLHTATLVHDDMVDQAGTRRGVTTVNKAVGDRASVLVGDYLFARAADLAALTNSVEVMHVFASTLVTIADGQLQEMFIPNTPEGLKQRYYHRIGCKTASLFETSSLVGAILGQCDTEARNALRVYGYSFGMAFQVVDDILDYIGYESDLGKPVGSDLRQGTITLPAILLMQKMPDDNPVQAIIDDEDGLEQNIAKVLKMARESGVLRASLQEASLFVDRAKSALSILPDNKYKQAMLDLADYILARAVV